MTIMLFFLQRDCPRVQASLLRQPLHEVDSGTMLGPAEDARLTSLTTRAYLQRDQKAEARFQAQAVRFERGIRDLA